MPHNATASTMQPLNANTEGSPLGAAEGCGVFLSFTELAEQCLPPRHAFQTANKQNVDLLCPFCVAFKEREKKN